MPEKLEVAPCCRAALLPPLTVARRSVFFDGKVSVRGVLTRVVMCEVPHERLEISL